MWLAIAWLLAACLLLPFVSRLQSQLEVEARVEGAEYGQVANTLKTDFRSVFADSLVLVVSGLTTHDTLSLEQILDRVVAEVESEPSVEGTLSYRNTRDPLFLGSGRGTGTLVIVGLKQDASTQSKEAMLARFRARTDNLTNDLHASAPHLALRWTGEAALNSDLRRISSEEAQQGERRVLPVVLIALVFAFGSLLAAIIPIGVGIVSVALALGIASIIAHWFSLSIVLVNVVTMLGLGLGIDYALLMVNRFREELPRGKSPAAAASMTAATAGQTIMLSSGTVAIGFCTLLLLPINEIRSIAVGGLLVLAISVLLVTTLLPMVLAQLGARVNALSFKSSLRAGQSHDLWRWWARSIFAHPKGFFLLGILPVLFLALQSLRIDISLPRGDWLPASAPSVQAVKDLKELGRSGFFQTINIIVTLRDGARVSDQSGWTRVKHIVDQLAENPRIAAVRSIVGANTGARPWEQIGVLPPQFVDTFLSTDRTKALVVVIPKADAQTFELAQLVRDIRANYARPSDRGSSVAVGGLPALNADYEDSVRGRFVTVALVVITMTFGILALGYQSLLLALKAIVLNVASVAAAFGALVLVFQDGIGGAWLGLSAPTGGVFPNIPILVFCIVFGLSMDYEVFLFNRIREAHRDGLDDADALTIGLSTTASVISSAALIMVVVFLGFCWGNFLLIKMLGFTLAAAVLIDVTLVRLVIGPALFALAGRWNWWPRI